MDQENMFMKRKAGIRCPDGPGHLNVFIRERSGQQVSEARMGEGGKSF